MMSAMNCATSKTVVGDTTIDDRVRRGTAVPGTANVSSKLSTPGKRTASDGKTEVE